MLDIVLTQQVVKSHDEDNEPLYAQIAFVLVVITWLAAVIVASRRKNSSSTFTADIMTAIFAPITYWILFAFQVLSH